MSADSKKTYDSDESLSSLRKDLTAYLAQKLSFSLFQPGKSEMLKARIIELVDAKLLEDGIPLEDATRETLVHQIIAGMPSLQGNVEDDRTEPSPPEPDESGLSVEQLQEIIKPYLAFKLSDDLFQADRKEELTRQIILLIDEKIRFEELEVAPELRDKLILLICRRMNLTPPRSESEPAPAAQAAPAGEPETKAFSPSEKAPAQPSAPPVKKKIPKPSSSTILPLKALTHEIKRDLLYDLSTRINPDIMTGGDELAQRTEIFRLIQSYCNDRRFTLNDQDVEKIVIEILSGEGLEFQL